MSPAKKIYLSLAIFGIISISIIFFVVYPFLKEIGKNSEDLIFQKKKLILFQKEIQNSIGISALYRIYKPNLDKIDNLFVNSEIPIEFISFLENNAETSQLVIEISPLSIKEAPSSQPGADSPWSSLSFQLSTIGSFSDFLKFFERLENCPYLIEVFNLNVRRLTQEGVRATGLKSLSVGDVNATFSIKVYTR